MKNVRETEGFQDRMKRLRDVLGLKEGDENMDNAKRPKLTPELYEKLLQGDDLQKEWTSKREYYQMLEQQCNAKTTTLLKDE